MLKTELLELLQQLSWVNGSFAVLPWKCLYNYMYPSYFTLSIHDVFKVAPASGGQGGNGVSEHWKNHK